MAQLVAEANRRRRPALSPVARTKPDEFMRALLRVDPRTDRTALIDARSAFGRSVMISGIRCVLTYLVIPILGAFSLMASMARPLSMMLCVVGAVFAVRSARRFWQANHRHRWSYTAFAGIILAYLTFGFMGDVAIVFGRIG